MRYMLTLIGEEGGWEDATPEQMRAQMGRWDAYTESLRDAGAFVAGEGLQDSPTATTIRIQSDGERVVTDGPFAETKEQVGGFYLLECDEPRSRRSSGRRRSRCQPAQSRSAR